MENCKTVSTPVAQWEKLTSNGNQERVNEKEYQSLVGCLLFMYVVSLLSRFMHCCDVVHFKAAKRVLRYVKGTLNYGVNFEKAKELKLIGYSDSDWARSIDDMKSTSGYFFTLGSRVFCWSSKKQQTIAQSTAKAEYIAAAAAVNQAIWLRKLLCDLNEEQIQATEIRVDNQSTVAIAKNPQKQPIPIMSFAGAPDNIRYEMNNQNRLLLCCHCGNHIVTLYNCGYYVWNYGYYLLDFFVNVRTDPLPSYWYLYDRPVLNVRCNDCNRHIGEQFMLNPKATTIKLESWILNANGCGCRDELLYWDGTRLHRAPYENGSA
ncbi:hypothetical protein CXB51_009093 [Gossypium anomalum]|uniref:Yippee domain-containing protein n=1 Tax=Gossypium anomalum TaxID=47600 RepID=A0A8J6D9R5_9ROSI|nr:hypothetical protein CXB51_009093 [Gossypium anomalum]